MANTKTKKIVFSEEIDSSINGFSLVLTFIGVGVFLTVNHQYFGNETISKVVRWFFIIVGVLGCITEISNLKKNKQEENIKGIDNLITGMILIGIWFVIYYVINNTISNSLGFCLLIFGTYGITRGLIEIIYSIVKVINEKKGKRNTIGNIGKSILLLLSQVGGIALIVVQILQAFKVM